MHAGQCFEQFMKYNFFALNMQEMFNIACKSVLLQKQVDVFSLIVIWKAKFLNACNLIYKNDSYNALVVHLHLHFY